MQLEATTAHQVTPTGFEYVEVAGDKAAMAEWIGEGVDDLPLRCALSDTSVALCLQGSKHQNLSKALTVQCEDAFSRMNAVSLQRRSGSSATSELLLDNLTRQL